jgi:hypothetical protein
MLITLKLRDLVVSEVENAFHLVEASFHGSHRSYYITCNPQNGWQMANVHCHNPKAICPSPSRTYPWWSPSNHGSLIGTF